MYIIYIHDTKIWFLSKKTKGGVINFQCFSDVCYCQNLKS